MPVVQHCVLSEGLDVAKWKLPSSFSAWLFLPPRVEGGLGGLADFAQSRLAMSRKAATWLPSPGGSSVPPHGGLLISIPRSFCF